jgi:Domain of unknown function (DUF4375)
VLTLWKSVGQRLTSALSPWLPKRSLEQRIYAVCGAADEHGMDALSAPQRTIVLAWAAKGIIGNGGFKYFYEGEWRGAELAQAYRALGFAAAAEACDRSLDAFPARQPPRDAARRYQYIAAGEDAVFGDLEDAIFALEWSALELAIGEYMAKHVEEFRRFR